MSCSVISGEPPLSFSWMKNGKAIETDDKIQIRQYEDVSILVIEPLTHNSNGNYTCVVKNSYGADEFTLPLLVKGTFHAKFNFITKHKSHLYIIYKYNYVLNFT